MKKLFDYIYSNIREVNFDENELCKMYWLKLERLKANFTDEAALQMLFDNIEWLISSGVVTGSKIKELGNYEKLFDAGIYFNADLEIKDGQAILFGKSRATVTGHSRVRCFDFSEVDADDSGFISAFHNSTVTAKNCKVVAFDRAMVKSRGLCLIEDYAEGGKIEATERDLVY